MIAALLVYVHLRAAFALIRAPAAAFLLWAGLTMVRDSAGLSTAYGVALALFAVALAIV